MERTLAIIKPDGVARGLIGEVIKRIEADHLEIIDIKVDILTKQRAKEFYKIHDGKPFFEDLVKFMSSDIIVVMVLGGLNAISRWRALMGATNSAEAKKGTIRGDFGDPNVIRQNVVHGSDSLETAKLEINYFFKELNYV